MGTSCSSQVSAEPPHAVVPLPGRPCAQRTLRTWHSGPVPPAPKPPNTTRHCITRLCGWSPLWGLMVLYSVLNLMISYTMCVSVAADNSRRLVEDSAMYKKKAQDLNKCLWLRQNAPCIFVSAASPPPCGPPGVMDVRAKAVSSPFCTERANASRQRADTQSAPVSP